MKKLLVMAAAAQILGLIGLSQVTVIPIEKDDSLIKLNVERIKKIPVVVIPTTPSTPEVPGTYGTLTYATGFEKASDINIYQGPLNRLSTLQAAEGVSSFRSEAGGPETKQSSGYRGEIQYNGAEQNPTEGVWEYDVYYENWGIFAGGGHSVQWHPNSSSGGAVLSLQNYGGKFNVVRSLGGKNSSQSSSTQVSVRPNKWYKMRWEIKWSTGSSGYIRLYIDNALYYSFKGVTSDGGQYFKLGQNRWSTICSDCPPSGPNTVVYYDNLKVYKR